MEKGGSATLVLFLFLLLLQFKESLSSGLLLRAGFEAALLPVLLMLQLQRLLRLCAHAALLELPPDLALKPFGVPAGFLFDGFNGRAEAQAVIAGLNKVKQVAVLRLRAENHPRGRELPILETLKDAHPEGASKNTVSRALTLSMAVDYAFSRRL